MSERSYLSFYETPYAGEEPLAVIAINVGVLTSGVSAWALYPGERTFQFEPDHVTNTSVKGVGKGFLLHFYPPETTLEIDGFQRPAMPQGVSPEMALTKLLSFLRNQFDTALGDVALWGIVKERARVIFTHPSAWTDKLDEICDCIRDAGWLGDGRELIFKSEEEGLIARIYEAELGSSIQAVNSPQRGISRVQAGKDTVVVTETGPSAVTISRLERDVDRPWIINRKWAPEACRAGFAVAYEHARVSVSAAYGTGYRLSYSRQQLEERSGAKERGDIDISENEANEVRARSVASLMERLPDHLSPDTIIQIGGNYIGSNEVQELVRQQLKSRGVQFGRYFGPPPSSCLSNQMCLCHNYVALLSYVFDNGLWKTIMPRQSEALQWASLDFGDYWCCQYTLNGVPPDLSFLVVRTLEADLDPPSPAVVSHIDKIRDSARKYYLQIRPWKTAETDVIFLGPVVENMKECFTSYTSFLSDSLIASESGHSLSDKCEMLCSKLGNGISDDEFQETVRDLQAMSKEGLEGAIKMAESLRSFRRTVLKTRRDAANMVLALRKVKASFDAIRFLDPDTVPAPLNEEIQSNINIPIEKKVVITAQGSQEANCDLIRAVQTLDLMEGYLDDVVSWWEETHTRLVNLEDRMHNIPRTITNLKVRRLVEGWGDLTKAYFEYQTTVKSLLKTA